MKTYRIHYRSDQAGIDDVRADHVMEARSGRKTYYFHQNDDMVAMVPKKVVPPIHTKNVADG